MGRVEKGHCRKEAELRTSQSHWEETHLSQFFFHRLEVGTGRGDQHLFQTLRDYFSEAPEL